MMLLYFVLVGAAVLLFRAVPGGFVPAQDKQYLIGFAQLPDGASLDRTEAVIRRMSDIALKQPGVENTVAFPGLSINGFTNSSNAGIVFRRFGISTSARRRLVGRRHRRSAQPAIRGNPEAFIAVFPPPPVQGIGHHWRLQAADRGPRWPGIQVAGRGHEELPGAAHKAPELAGHVHGLADQCAAALRRYRSHPRPPARASPCRTCSTRCRSISARSIVNDFNTLRPHLFGAGAGRRAVPRARRRYRPAEGALGQSGDGAAVGAC